MTNVIGLVGLKQHGKDTAADILVKEYGFKKGAFAKLLKNICMEHFGLSQEQVYGSRKEVPDERWRDSKGNARTPRFILQHLGTQGFRDIDPDYWVKAFFRSYSDGEKYVVCDVRFPNELEAIISRGGKIWVVDMPGKPNDELSFLGRLLSWLLKLGPYHQSETMARRLTKLGRKGKLDPGLVYVPFSYGERHKNFPTVQKAWHETSRPVQAASHLKLVQ